MNTPRTDKVCELLIGAPLNGHPLADLSRQLEIQVQELREAIEMALDDPDSEILGESWENMARAAIAKAKGN